MVHQIAPSAFKMKKGGGHIFQLSLICTLKAIEVIKKVKKRKKDWVTELRQINTLWSHIWAVPLHVDACVFSDRPTKYAKESKGSIRPRLATAGALRTIRPPSI